MQGLSNLLEKLQREQHNGRLLAIGGYQTCFRHIAMSTCDAAAAVVKECSFHVENAESALTGFSDDTAAYRLNSCARLNSTQLKHVSKFWGEEGTPHAENERMGAAKAKLWSLLAILGSLGCSLMPPGDCRF